MLAVGPTGDIYLLRITTEQKRGKLVLSIEGRLAGQSVGTLEQCWRELRASSPSGKFSVNLCGVSYIDAAGKVLLKEIHHQGGHLLAEGCLNQAVVKEIVGCGNPENTETEGAAAPAKPKKGHIIFYLLFL
ncbi:MAG TPA: STAS domain-containing protein, partial [Candidatus Acidoferrum sp.]|nr:STAS domain-containing protein [Candidatus Acidoferrum sp.]